MQSRSHGEHLTSNRMRNVKCSMQWQPSAFIKGHVGFDLAMHRSTKNIGPLTEFEGVNNACSSY